MACLRTLESQGTGHLFKSVSMYVEGESSQIFVIVTAFLNKHVCTSLSWSTMYGGRGGSDLVDFSWK
jgi:hypothetical protein